MTAEADRLKEFCAVDSTTLNKSGVQRLQDKVGQILSGLGFKLTWHRHDPRFADLLVAERPGQSNRFITLVTHTDTVLPNFTAPPPTEVTTFGSGVIDNKGGLIVGLSALEQFCVGALSLRHGLRFVCSPNEEMGSIGFTEIFRALGRDTSFGLGLEPALDDGSIIHQRRGNRWYDIEITGRPAHAGRSYGRDANAAHDLALKITRLARLTNYRAHVSVNVGHIQAGLDKHNVVCGFAHAKLDVRFPTFAARDRVHRRIDKILGRVDARSVDGQFKARTQYQIVDDCPPFSVGRRASKIVKRYLARVTRLEGRLVKAAVAGGAGDVNYLSTDQNIVLDGLGPVGGEMHTVQEFLNTSTLRTRSRALAQFLGDLQDQ